MYLLRQIFLLILSPFRSAGLLIWRSRYNFKDDFRHAPGGQDWVSLPEVFKNSGYNATGCGKTYHPGHPANWDM